MSKARRLEATRGGGGGRLVALVVLGLAVGGAACGGAAFDERSSEDAKRGGAVTVPLNAPTDDRLSSEQGDNTDWKVFSLGESAEVTVRVWWDDPRVEGSVVVRSPEARTEVSEAHRMGARRDVIGPLRLAAGDHYIQLQLTAGASVYTLEVLTAAGASGGAGSAGGRPDF